MRHYFRVCLWGCFCRPICWTEYQERSTLSASAGTSMFPAHQHQRPWVSDSWTHTRNFTIGPTSKVWTWPEPHHQFCLFFGFGDSRLSGFTVSSHHIFVYICTYVLTHTSMHGYGYMFCSSHMRLACLFFKKASSHSFPISSPVSTPFSTMRIYNKILACLQDWKHTKILIPDFPQTLELWENKCVCYLIFCLAAWTNLGSRRGTEFRKWQQGFLIRS